MSQQNAESRVHERYECKVRTACQPAGSNETRWDATIEDISRSGARLRLGRRFEPRTGHRRLVSIFEVTGLEGDVLTGNELWAFDAGRDRLVWTGIPPRCLDKIAARGVRYAPPPARDPTGGGHPPGQPGRPRGNVPASGPANAPASAG